MADVRWTELRGVVVVALAVAAIAISWTIIENRGTDGDAGPVATRSTTTTTTVPPTTTRR